jgi:lysophospholipid acyltransferase (LPLAT)-like uncharacterized protein
MLEFADTFCAMKVKRHFAEFTWEKKRIKLFFCGFSIFFRDGKHVKRADSEN